jgi:hypothetical protein
MESLLLQKRCKLLLYATSAFRGVFCRIRNFVRPGVDHCLAFSLKIRRGMSLALQWEI